MSEIITAAPEKKVLNEEESRRVDSARFDAEKISRPVITYWQ